jgi:hypothetical protein
VLILANLEQTTKQEKYFGLHQYIQAKPILHLGLDQDLLIPTTKHAEYVSIMTYAEFVDDAIAESVSFQSNGDVTKKDMYPVKIETMFGI